MENEIPLTKGAGESYRQTQRGLRVMKWWERQETLQTLREEHSFSSDEYETLVQNINEELEQASSDILRAWDKEAHKARKAGYHGF
jgi:hypothetical protein